MDVGKFLTDYNITQQQLADFTTIPRHRIAKWATNKAQPKAADTAILNAAAHLFQGKTSQEIAIILKEGNLKKYTDDEENLPAVQEPASGMRPAIPLNRQQALMIQLRNDTRAEYKERLKKEPLENIFADLDIRVLLIETAGQ